MKTDSRLIKKESKIAKEKVYQFVLEGGTTELSNSGNGYSKGFEMFWRNDLSKDGIGQDIWIAYSYLDSKRKFKQYYENEIIPSFASEHKFTFVYKNTFDLKYFV